MKHKHTTNHSVDCVTGQLMDFHTNPHSETCLQDETTQISLSSTHISESQFPMAYLFQDILTQSSQFVKFVKPVCNTSASRTGCSFPA